MKPSNRINRLLRIEETPVGGAVLQLSPANLIPNRGQPRREFEQNAMIRLADSIHRYGILQPLSVRECRDRPGIYEVVAGERRLRAAQMLGLETVPCVLCAADDQSAAELAIVENLLREDLNMFDQAGGFRTLIETYGLTQEEVARRLSLSQSAVSNKLRLLKLSPEEQAAILENALTERHARALLRLPAGASRAHALNRIIAQHMNVMETEAYIDRMLAVTAKKGESASSNPVDARQRIESFRDHLSRMVESLRRSGADVRSEQQETSAEYIIQIRVPKEFSAEGAHDVAGMPTNEPANEAVDHLMALAGDGVQRFH